MADRAAPAALGFSMPAEWEPHATTWIGWPHNSSDLPGKLAVIQWVYGEIVRRLAPGETVRILVQSGEHERQARRTNMGPKSRAAPCGGRDRAVPLQCLGQVPRLEERRPGPRTGRSEE